MDINKNYFFISLLVLAPIGLLSAFYNFQTLNVVSSMLPGYPADFIMGDAFKPDIVTRFLHRIGYEGILIVVFLVVVIIATTTFFTKVFINNRFNYLLLIAGLFFVSFSFIWVCVPLIIYAN